jgi:hypothetical protein
MSSQQTIIHYICDQVKCLRKPNGWTWAAMEGTDQYEYNHARLQLCVRDEFTYVIKHREKCQPTGLLVGDSEVDSRYCELTLYGEP